jgi:hypothetical protein
VAKVNFSVAFAQIATVFRALFRHDGFISAEMVSVMVSASVISIGDGFVLLC